MLGCLPRCVAPCYSGGSSTSSRSNSSRSNSSRGSNRRRIRSSTISRNKSSSSSTGCSSGDRSRAMTCARPRFVCVLALLGFAAARFEEHCLAKTPGCRIAQVMKKTYQKSIQRFILFFHVFTKNRARNNGTKVFPFQKLCSARLASTKRKKTTPRNNGTDSKLLNYLKGTKQNFVPQPGRREAKQSQDTKKTSLKKTGHRSARVGVCSPRIGSGGGVEVT